MDYKNQRFPISSLETDEYIIDPKLLRLQVNCKVLSVLLCILHPKLVNLKKYSIAIFMVYDFFGKRI